MIGKRWAWDLNVVKGVRRGVLQIETHHWKGSEIRKSNCLVPEDFKGLKGQCND